MLSLLMVLEVWAVVSTPRTQNSLISAIVVQCVSHSFTQGMLYSEVMTAVCSVYLRKPRTFIVLHPSFEGVSSPCVRIGKHIGPIP